MLISNFFRAVASAGFLSSSSPNSLGSLKSIRPTVGTLPFSLQHSHAWMSTTRVKSGDDNDEGEQGNTKPKNPFLGVSLGNDDGGDSEGSPVTRNRLLKEKKVKTSSSWMERNDAFSQNSEETSTPPRERRFDSSSSPSRSSPPNGRSSRSEFGDRSPQRGRGGGRSDFGGRSSSSSSSFRRWDNDERGPRDSNSDRPRFRDSSDRPRSRDASDRPRSRDSSDRPRTREYSDRPRTREYSDRPRTSSFRNKEREPRDSSDRSTSFRQDFRGTRVFVQGLSPDTTWQSLKDHFRIAGEVVFASVSVDPRTGESKGHGIVQYETTDMANEAINVMREHPLDGETLYVRADVQESRPDRDGSFTPRSRTATSSVSSLRPSSSSSSSGTPSSWRCADEETIELIPEEDQKIIMGLIKSRDAARRQRDYDTSDDLRAELKSKFGVHIDDRLKMWWVSLDGSEIPTAIREIKGDGRWGKAQSWRQIPTTPENDICVNADLVNALLAQRDIARKEKDFTTADRLLQQARTSPDGDLELRIHDESRTWRIWTEDPPPRPDRPPRKSPIEQCLDIVREHAPHKEEEITLVLKKFPGREYKILRKLQQRYLNNNDNNEGEEEEGEIVLEKSEEVGEEEEEEEEEDSPQEEVVEDEEEEEEKKV